MDLDPFKRLKNSRLRKGDSKMLDLNLNFKNFLIGNMDAALEKANVDTEFAEAEPVKDDYQIDRVPKTYVLLNNHWETIEKELPKHKAELIKFIGKYRNNNIDKLETPYPVDYPAWVPVCNRILYQCTGIDEKKFVDDVLTIRGWEGYEDTYLKDKAPHILMLMIARWFMIHDYNTEYEIMKHYIGYAHYWGVFTDIFKRYKPNLEVMKYTISQMSYKSRLKSLGSVDKWLAEGVGDTLVTYKDRLMRASDFELHYIQEKIRGKFKSAFKTIYRAQEANERDGKRIFTSKDNVSAGEDEVSVENTYGMAQALQIANGFTTKFFANPVDEDCLKRALIPNGITEKDLRNVIIMIADNRDNIDDVRRFYQSLFYSFLESGKYKQRDIGTLRFYAEMDKMYKPGNTNDPNKIFVKELLDKWLAIGSKTFRTTNRVATQTTFRRSIYSYFILKIMKDK